MTGAEKTADDKANDFHFSDEENGSDFFSFLLADNRDNGI